jgi:hypothetical protein
MQLTLRNQHLYNPIHEYINYSKNAKYLWNKQNKTIKIRNRSFVNYYFLMQEMEMGL